MFSEVVWKSSTFNKYENAWPSVDGCSDFEYIKMFQLTAYFNPIRTKRVGGGDVFHQPLGFLPITFEVVKLQDFS